MRLFVYAQAVMALVLAHAVQAGADTGRDVATAQRFDAGESTSRGSKDRLRIAGTREGEHLVGTDQNDVLIGRRGDDRLEGLGGNDVLKGGRGDDELDGGPGTDVLRGNRGDDLLWTDGHGDTLVGGRGDDSFYIAAGSQGKVKIRDFDPDDDRLVIAIDGLHTLSSENVIETRRKTTLVLTTDTSTVEVVLRGVKKDELHEAAIEFVSNSPGYGNLRLLSLYDDRFAHEGPVYLEDSEMLVFTSNRLTDQAGDPFVAVSGYDTDSGETVDLGLSDAIPMANGAVLSRAGSIIFCRQGNLDFPAGLALYDPDTGEVSDLVSEVDGMEFNSPNDVVESSLGEVWFTDPQYGYKQGFRPTPELADSIWLYDPATGEFTQLADDLNRPNGLALSNDEQVLYVTASGYEIGDGTQDPNGPRDVYRYRVNRENGEVSISDRELLARATNGIPDGVKVDEEGNVWFATGDGLHTLDQDDVQIGMTGVPGGTSNFAITEEGIFVMGESALYMLPREERDDD